MDAAGETIVLLSRARPDRAGARRFESDLVDLLAPSAPVLVADDLYDQPDQAPLWDAVRASCGPLLVLGWRPPRALYWLLRTRGVEGDRVDPGAPPGPGRPLVCLDLGSLAAPVDALERLAGRLPPAAAAPLAVRLFPAAARRWYPVLDLSRCSACGQCREFCLFGVYERSGAGPPRVVRPDRCKDGCPACARICPAHAILFPDHEAIPAVAGADSGEIPPFDPAELALRRRKNPDPILDVLDEE